LATTASGRFTRSGDTLRHEDYLQRRQFPALNGLRAASILLVIGAHVHNSAINQVANGVDGVVLFFVISGFLITSLCLREEDRRGRMGWRSFAIRRAFRILPLYYAVLIVYTVYVLVLHMDHRLHAFKDALPYYAGFLQEVPRFSHPGLPFEVSWSLGVEEKFYLLWPVIAFLLLRHRREWRLPVAVGCAVVASAAPIFFPYSGMFVFFESGILWGCALALLLHSAPSFERLRWMGHPRVLVVLVLLAVAVKFSTRPLGLTAKIALPFAFALMIGGFVVTKASWARGLDRRRIVIVGEASYAIYLLHQLVLNGYEKVIPHDSRLAPGLFVLVVGGATSIIVGIYVQKYFEKPTTAYGHRLARKYQPAELPTPVRVDEPTAAASSAGVPWPVLAESDAASAGGR
jgi:peptidoglycan/LPS O-acetylase OafA/YrhL